MKKVKDYLKLNCLQKISGYDPDCTFQISTYVSETPVAGSESIHNNSSIYNF